MRRRGDLPLLRWAETAQAKYASRERLRQRRRVSFAIGGAALLLLPVLLRPAPRLLWNVSPSAPVGLYRVAPGTTTVRGELAVVVLPTEARRLAAQRNYLPANVPLLKPVAATGGQQVCARGDRILIDGHRSAVRLRHDAAGRALPWWDGCRVLRPDEVFLLGTRRPDSFDGRYFGPVGRARIVGTARPIWVR